MSTSNTAISKDKLLQALKSMLLIRHFEQKCGQIYNVKGIFGFCHLYIGQEAVATAVSLAKDQNDAMITAYRCHGHAILSGIEPKFILSELMGKSTGVSKGKGGSMHLFSLKNNFYGGHGIVGAQVSIGVGVAFSYKYRKQNNIVYNFFGDGAANQGQVFESFNMSAKWSLPVAYIIENNGYAISTPISRASCDKTPLYKRGEAFGMPCYQIDGMKIDELYNHFNKISNDIKNGSGPILTEVLTYRYKGHSVSDPAQYRTKEEVASNKERDPIEYAKSLIIKNGYLTEQEIKEIEKEVKLTIKEAVTFAEQSSYPDSSELYTDVMINNY